MPNVIRKRRRWSALDARKSHEKQVAAGKQMQSDKSRKAQGKRYESA